MKRGLQRGLFIVLALVIVGAVGIGIRSMYFSGKSSSGLDIGGAFALTDQNGRTVQDSDFHGKLMLVYFGYTYCPDVCPTELQTLTAALTALGPQAKEIQPLFITIDPARDTPAVLKDYISNFYPSFLGLSGTPEQIANVARRYHVYYAKAGDQKATQDYTMDHSGFVYLIGRKGQYLGNFVPSTTPEAIAKSLTQALQAG